MEECQRKTSRSEGHVMRREAASGDGGQLRVGVGEERKRERKGK